MLFKPSGNKKGSPMPPFLDVVILENHKTDAD
jgi:hypothetical protein